jgi:hypothetical protein
VRTRTYAFQGNLKKREVEKNWKSRRIKLTYGRYIIDHTLAGGLVKQGLDHQCSVPPGVSLQLQFCLFLLKTIFFFPGSFPKKNLGGVLTQGASRGTVLDHLCSDFPYGFNLTNPVK